jgi:hypothetical protein
MVFAMFDKIASLRFLEYDWSAGAILPPGLKSQERIARVHPMLNGTRHFSRKASRIACGASVHDKGVK